jgi:protein-L-isoaspartate(D-aspartate) O-methyltransferase
VVPLRWRGQTRAVAFTSKPGRLRSDAAELCGFVPMIGQGGEHDGPIDPGGHVTLYWDAGQPIDPATLHGVLGQPKIEAWTGVTVGPCDSFDGVWLRMTGTEPGTCRIAADATAAEMGLCTPAIPIRSPALVEGGSLSYFTFRRLEPEGSAGRRSELGAFGYGRGGQQLAERLCDQIRAWDRDRAARPAITAYPADTPDDQLPAGLVIGKRHIRLVVSF